MMQADRVQAMLVTGKRFESITVARAVQIRPNATGQEACPTQAYDEQMRWRLVPLWFAFFLLLVDFLSPAATRRILYVTATYGFRHSDSIDASIAVFRELAQESGVLEIVNTEDVSLLTAENLRNYDAVYFFTSGELPLSDQQKADLLDFVRSGKGFGGSHSATDCLYTWPEYGEMIGGYFDGHPWAQEAAVDVEDAQSPFVAGAAPAFRFIGGVLPVPQLLARPRARAAHARYALGGHERARHQSHRWRFPACLDPQLRPGPCLLQRVRPLSGQFPPARRCGPCC